MALPAVCGVRHRLHGGVVLLLQHKAGGLHAIARRDGFRRAQRPRLIPRGDDDVAAKLGQRRGHVVPQPRMPAGDDGNPPLEAE